MRHRLRKAPLCVCGHLQRAEVIAKQESKRLVVRRKEKVASGAGQPLINIARTVSRATQAARIPVASTGGRAWSAHGL